MESLKVGDRVRVHKTDHCENEGFVCGRADAFLSTYIYYKVVTDEGFYRYFLSSDLMILPPPNRVDVPDRPGFWWFENRYGDHLIATVKTDSVSGLRASYNSEDFDYWVGSPQFVKWLGPVNPEPLPMPLKPEPAESPQ